jgi:6-phosphogluconolactonase
MKQLAFILLFFAVIGSNAQRVTYLFVGTYTDGKPAKGIYVYRMNMQTGDLSATGSGVDITNPSFLAISSNGQYLYACTDTKTAVAGSISAFSIDSINGHINFINKKSSEGANPVYVTADRTNRFVIGGNYTEGNVAVLTANQDGSLNAAIQTIQFIDSSINKERQAKAHIHSVIFSPGDNYLYLPDLGADKIRTFSFNSKNRQPLVKADDLTVNTAGGSGPRHLVFHPNKKFAYCVEEMGGSISVYRYNQGHLLLLQRLNANRTQAAEYSSADIHISPDGLFLYASNRVENTIAIFSIDAAGQLKLLGHEPTRGEVPRNFCIDPHGRFLLVANQNSNNVVVFKRDAGTGLLSYTGLEIAVPAPSCLQMRDYGK